MLKLVLLSIGLLLVAEAILYFLIAEKIKTIFEQLSNIDPQKIKTISLIMLAIGLCLIYITFRLYGDL